MDDLNLDDRLPPATRKRDLLEDLNLTDLSPVQLMRFVDVDTAAELRTQSPRAVERRFAGEWTQLGPRRKAIRLYQALELPAPKLPK
jgi:hypothetical protein